MILEIFGILTTVTSTPCHLLIDACVKFQENIPIEVQIRKEELADPLVLYHELAHIKYHKYFTNTSTVNFWKKQKYWSDYSTRGTKEWRENLEEIMACYYEDWKTGEKIPKLLKKWFNSH